MKHEKIACNLCQAHANSLLNQCDDNVRELVEGHKYCNAYKKGQILFFEGNRPLGVFCINRGTVKLYKTGIDGKEQIVRFAQTGDMLGYRALIAEEAYSVTAEALESTVACFIPKHEFQEILNTQPNFTKALMKSLSTELGVSQEHLLNMAQKSVRERLAETLLLLLDNFHREGVSEDTIAVQMPREDIANVAGTSTETVIRLLSEFKDQGLVELTGKKITILQRDKLARLARSGM